MVVIAGWEWGGWGLKAWCRFPGQLVRDSEGELGLTSAGFTGEEEGVLEHVRHFEGVQEP